jgi:DNA-binding beta-propeller fold protein YncE
MRTHRSLITAAASLTLLLVGQPKSDGPPRAADPVLPGGETALEAVARENACEMPGVAEQAPAWPDWGSADIAGGDVPPTRVVSDPYPILHSVAVDPDNDRVVFSDPNRHALWTYERGAASKGDEAVVPLTSIRGPATGMMFIASVKVDPARREIYTVDNDIGDRMMVFPYEASGNVKPKRVLNVPHQAWGLSINHKRDELAVTVESSRMVVIYKREASRSDAPLRVIRGPKTGLGDPHGVYFDAVNDEIVVANHGNQGGRPAPDGRTSGVRNERAEGATSGGRFEPPSITVYAGDANGNVDPRRRIQGPATRLNWPMSVDVDPDRGEIAVANNGDSSILVFRRTDTGDVAPARVLKGPRTGIVGPMGVTYDLKHDELWVANYGDHTALVFARDASGNVAPKRILRNAPGGSATIGFGNPGAVAYDTKRGEILVPN